MQDNAHSGIFDGHGGEAAADYLRKNFYNAFSSLVSEEAYAEECSVEGNGFFPWQSLGLTFM